MNDRQKPDHSPDYRDGEASCQCGKRSCNKAIAAVAITNSGCRNGQQQDAFALSDDDGPAGKTCHVGPGSELKRMLPWLSAAAKSGVAKRRITTMNQWGVKGCRLNAESIAAWLVDEAARQGGDFHSFTLTTARALVQTATRRFERKFPDGSLDGD